MASLSTRIKPGQLSVQCVPELEDDAIEHIDAVETLLDQKSDLAKLAAFQRVRELAANGRVTPETVDATRRAIARDVEAFEALIAGHNKDSGEHTHEDVEAFLGTR